MAEVSSNNTTTYHDIQYIDVEINDFAELSDLLGDDFTSEGPCVDLDKSVINNQKEMQQSSPPLPEFNLTSAPKEFLYDDLSSISASDFPSKMSGQILDAARVSPTPSSSTSFSMALIDSLPSFPKNAQDTLPEHSPNSTNKHQLPDASRKRKKSEFCSDSSSQETSKRPCPTPQNTKRRERNREHAKKSRSKKKDLMKQLEETVAILRVENQKLKDILYTKLQASKEETEKMIKERTLTPSERFVAALKDPSNRVLSNSTISYLQRLGKDYG